MKKTLILTIMFLFLSSFLYAGSAIAGTDPGTGIKGTAHDLRSNYRGAKYGANDSLNRICVWCHAPHHTLKPADVAGDIDYLPLWNHTTTTMVFQPYTNGADDPNDPNHISTAEQIANQPGSVSKLCLSCHDGTVGVNEYGFEPGDINSSGVRKGDTLHKISAEYNIGKGGDLSNHHPIGFDYQTVEAVDDEIQKASAPMNSYYTIGDLLWAGKMECTTCHDVHNTKNEGEKFLWKSDRESGLCLTCHLKGDVKK